MPPDFDVLAIRRRLGRDAWAPPRLHGPSGTLILRGDRRRSVIVTSSTLPDSDDVVWLHASIASQPESAQMPAYEELVMLRHAVWGEHGWALQVFAPPDAHINIRTNALHLWGRLDGRRIHPNFGWAGTI